MSFFDVKVKEDIVKEAKKDGRSYSNLINKILKEWLENREGEK